AGRERFEKMAQSRPENHQKYLSNASDEKRQQRRAKDAARQKQRRQMTGANATEAWRKKYPQKAAIMRKRVAAATRQGRRGHPVETRTAHRQKYQKQKAIAKAGRQKFQEIQSR
ncbi:unnamed protein product, partial [Prorocentrum cordatum]